MSAVIRRILSLLLTILLLSTAAGCSRSGEAVLDEVYYSSFFYSFTDDVGRSVTLQKQPKTVAVLFSSFAEVWTLAGGEVAVTVGESVERGFVAVDTPLVDDGAGKTINMELLLAAEPDFVICSADIEAQAQAAELLASAGIPAACFRVETFEDYLRMLRICTEITGDASAYETYGLTVQREIDALRQNAAAQEETRNILFIRAGSSDSATKAKTAEQHFAAAMLEELGAYNIADAAPVLLDGLSIEEILRADPEIIFVSTMGKESAATAHMEEVLSQPVWQTLSAVQNGRVVYLPKDMFQFKPNARWGEAYAYLIEVLYGA